MSPQQTAGVTCVLADHQGDLVDQKEQTEKEDTNHTWLEIFIFF